MGFFPPSQNLKFGQRYTFSENLNIQENTRVIAIIVTILYILTFSYPYIIAYNKNKLGFSSLNPKKDLFLSTALEYTNKLPQVSIVYVFIISIFWYLGLQNYFNIIDVRTIVPITTMLMGLLLINILWYNTKYGKIHNLITISIMSTGVILSLTLYFMYERFFDEDLKELRQLVYILVSITILIILLVSTKLFPSIGKYFLLTTKYKNITNDIFGLLEILHLFIFGIILSFVTITYPQLPYQPSS